MSVGLRPTYSNESRACGAGPWPAAASQAAPSYPCSRPRRAESPPQAGSLPHKTTGERANGPEPPARRSVPCAPRGVTLIEMMIVVVLIGVLVGITFPSVSSGVETLRLNAAGDSLVSFFNDALNRAERRQQAVEITILRPERALVMRSSEPGFERRLELSQGITIRAVLPPVQADPGAPRSFVLLPGGAIPRLGIEIANGRNARRIVRVDPITGVPQIERPQ